MDTATVELRKTHKVVRKVLKELNVGSARFPDVLKTLQRTVAAHAFFVDKFLIPAFKNNPLVDKGFLREIKTEHKDIDRLIAVLRKIPLSRNKALDAYALQIQVMIEANLTKEAEGLYVLAEEFLDVEKLKTVAEEMDRRKIKLRKFVGIS